jgi:hypothetical protein
MSYETNNPQPSDPPVGGSGGGTEPTSTEDVETDEALMSDPPTTGTGGGGGS